MREAIYSIRYSEGLKSKVKTLIAQITQLEHGLEWKMLFYGCFKRGKVNSVHFKYFIEILEEEWTKRQEVLVIREMEYD